MLKVNVKGQGDFFKKLADEGITKEVYVPGTRKRVLTLSTDGIEEAKLLNPMLAIRQFRRFPLHTLIHSYSIQLFLTSQNGIKEFFSETELAKERYVRRPDLLIINSNDVRIAVEVELTQKDTNRIYHNFYSHSVDWQKGLFEHVMYLFSSADVQKNYTELYNKNPWPKFISSDGNVRHITRVGSVDPQPIHDHGLIIFRRFEPYKM